MISQLSIVEDSSINAVRGPDNKWLCNVCDNSTGCQVSVLLNDKEYSCLMFVTLMGDEVSPETYTVAAVAQAKINMAISDSYGDESEITIRVIP